jgi:hypothetical protein
MHQGFYHPPVVRRGAHPIREYGASDASATAYPVLKPAVKPASTGAYSDTGGYAWSYDSFSKAIRMIASPKDDQPAWQFDPSHSQWQRIYDAVIAKQMPMMFDEAVGVAKGQGGKRTRMPQRQYATCGTVALPPINLKGTRGYGTAIAPRTSSSDFQRAADPFDLTGSKAAKSSSLFGIDLTPMNVALVALAALGLVSLVRRTPSSAAA